MVFWISLNKFFYSICFWIICLQVGVFDAGGDFYHNSKPESGELKIVSLLISVDIGNEIIHPPVDYDKQDKDFQWVNQRIQENSYGQAWYIGDIYPPKGEDPLIVDGTEFTKKEVKDNKQIFVYTKARNRAKERWDEDIEDGVRHVYGRLEQL